MAKKLKEANHNGNQIELKPLDFLSGGGEMGKFIRSKDWANTPLGSPETWPQSLRTTISLCIASSFPIAIVWGPHRVQIYNDGYWPITGDMHPTSMGQDFKACWHSAWTVIGQAFEEASLGKTCFLENQRIFLDRYGYKEETFFTFSFSPILDESGAVGGLFHPVIELTQQTLAERRLNILSTLANHTVKARTADEAAVLIMDCLKDFELDLPFVLLYSVAADGKETILNGCVGVEKDSPLAPAKTNLEDLVLKGWPFSEVIQHGKVVHVEELAEIFGTFNCGSYPEPPKLALVFPLIIPSATHNKYFLVAGVSSRRKLDEKYLLFYELLAESVTNVLSKARAYEEERRKAEALAEIDKAKTVFFSNISHEFRTPLTLMLSPLEELLNQKKNNFSQVETGYIQTTHRNAIRLLKLVNTLLDFSRIESGREQAVFSLVDIVVLTKNLASNFRSVIEKAGLELVVRADSITQSVYVDKQMWEKIVFNLLSNAFKYTLEGKITVELTAENDFAVLKVRDTGVGIPENEMPKMFERFHRVQNVTGRTYEGTGIGLSLIKELVVMHQGTIDVESKLNEGSVFTVRIPFGKEHLDGQQISKTGIDSDEISSNVYVEEIETLLEIEKQEALKPSLVQRKNILPTILVVDDNADMREHICSILSNHFNVVTAYNGMDALHKMKETIPALVLSDIMMPVMDGIGLLKEIKSNKATENIPVIFLTARAGEELKIEGWETGADDYLVKPFSSKELISRIASQIKTQQIRAAAEILLKNILMQAPVAISVIEVPGYKYLLINSEAQQLFSRSAEQVVGKSVNEIFPEAEAQGLIQIMDQVYSTGETYAVKEMPLLLDALNDGVLHQRYLNFSVELIKNVDCKVHSLLVVCIDVTQQVEARKKIEESEKQQAFLLKLSDALCSLSNPQDIEEAASKIALDFMDADRCYYSTIEGENVIILRDAVRGNLPSVAGVHSIGNFALYKAVLNAGRPFVVDDVRTSNKLDEDLKKVCLQFQYDSFINVPVIKNGKSVGLFSLVESKPRKWTDLEMQLTVETAERTWAAVERAKAEEALRKSEEQLAFDLTGAKKLQAISTQLIHDDNIDLLYEQLLNAAIDLMHAEMASIQVYHPEKKQLQLLAHKGYHPASAAHWEWVSTDSKSACGAALLKGERCIISDVEKDEQTSAIESLRYYQLSGIRAVQSTPLISRNGVLLGMISTLWQEPHEPSERDLQLFDVLARQAADLIERKKSVEKIKESESRFRTMADASPVLIWTIDANGSSTYYNKTFLDFIGVSKEEDISDWGNIVHPQDVQSTFDIINTAISKNRSYSLECRLLRSDGVWRWVLAQGNPRLGDNHEFLGFVGSSVDITERKQAEEKVKESEHQYQEMIHSSPSMISILKGEDMVIEIANDSILQSWGKRKNIVGKSLLEALPEVKEQGFDKWLMEVYKTGNPYYAYETPVVYERNGKTETVYYNFLYQPQRSINGIIEGVAIIATEVTTQAIANKKIVASEQNVSRLFMQAPAIICVLRGPQHIFELANAMYLQLVGNRDIVGKPIRDAIPELDGTGIFEILDEVYTTGEPFIANELPVTLLKESGKLEEGFFNFIYQASHDANGHINGILVHAVEVTDQVFARKKIEESEKKFEAAILAVEGIIWTNNANGEMIGEQSGWSNLTGQCYEEYQGYGWTKSIHPDDVKPTLVAWNNAVENRITFEFEHRLNTKEDGWRIFSVKAVPAFDENGAIQQWVGVHTDIHEKREAENQIKESEERYRSLVNAAPIAIGVLRGRELIVENPNQTYLTMAGKDESMIGKPLADAMPEHEDQPFLKILDDVYTSGIPYSNKAIPGIVLKNGRPSQGFYDISFTPLVDSENKVYAILNIALDVTEQIELNKKIKESEQYFRRLTDTVPAIIWITEPDGRCSYLNKPWYDYTGQTEEEAKGFGWLEATHPDDKVHSSEIFIKANAAQKPFSISYRLRNSKGEYRWAIDSGSPRFNADNVFVGMIGTVVDVHEEKLAEEKLAYRTALLEAHNEASVDGLLIVDAKGKIISYNQRFIEIWNMPQHIVDAKDDEAALSFAMMQLVNPQQFIDKVKYLYEHPKETSLDELEFKNGKLVERNGYPVVGEDSIYYAWSWTFKDITLQKNHEKTIIESEERFRSLAQNLPQLIWVTDSQGNQEFASLRWKEYSGIAAGDENEWKAIVHPDDYDHINAAWMHSLSTGEIYNSDVRLKNKNGEYRWHTVIGEPVLDKKNKIVKWVGAFTDTHSEKLFTQELELKVKMRTNELELFNVELERKNKELESFAYISSHDLQEPLRKIQIFASRIIAKEYEALSELGKDNFKRMQDAANRMQTLIQDLLLYSQTKTIDRQFEITDLNTIIDEVKEDLSEEMESKHATLDAVGLCNVKIIPFQFRQLMYNLIANALKFSAPNIPPHIIIKSEINNGIHFNNEKLEPQNMYCHITVTDNGIGFDQQYSEKIFKVFQRLHGKNEYIGTGIGLSIVKKIVENHEGVITATSELDKGATFDIYIPTA